jgi:polyhydroxybutyrate depolymerase
LRIAFLLLAVLTLAQAKGPSGEQDVQQSLAFEGRERTYRVFVPDGYGRSGPAPAIFLFNGSGSPVDGLLGPWKEVARRDGVMLIGQTAFKSGAWRIPEDSPELTGQLLEALKDRFPIDPRRVYLFGHSGGAGHVILLGLLESECFAAVGAHAGVLRPDDRKLLDVPQRKIPIAIWIGTRDQLVPLKMARDTLAILTKRGFPARLSEIDGHGHSYAERAKDVTEEAWAFLRKEVLPADPRYYRYSFKPQP